MGIVKTANDLITIKEKIRSLLIKLYHANEIIGDDNNYEKNLWHTVRFVNKNYEELILELETIEFKLYEILEGG
ncbi:MAG TPA: hypothetical protein VNU45_19815 [Rummeliibacillus sp.]|nr:hypothetical protein [Rummeliibacillus sp.]